MHEEVSQDIETKEALKPKRSVKEFLSKYRALGLPGAKKFKRRTRLQEAAWKMKVADATIRNLISRYTKLLKAIAELEKESNWTVRPFDPRDEENSPSEVVWVGESDPLEILRQAKKEAA